MKNSIWNDFVELFKSLQKLFGPMGSMIDYNFIIVNKRVKFDSKEVFIEFIDKYQIRCYNIRYYESGSSYPDLSPYLAQEKIMLLLFRVFHALRLSLQELDKYYRNVPQIYYRQYPLFLDLTLTSQSEEAISPQLSNYLLWNATLQADNKIQEFSVYVKAVQRKYYSPQAQRILYENGHYALS
ncbi:hypothetical protein RhiirC2_791895 [Rhizophagus irregularis]|uniref:Uncharacterized protein n=1 Tax=Rhizophagus irregularis TaxID=588596 RepID=A0A2N1MIC0_9GLOM|nr:hypothetical protein RhiirC2_791895 [Rhizophagus irregularis]